MDRPYVDEASLYKAEYKKGTKGPCWDGYTYVGDTPYSKGSCVKNAETFYGDITTEPILYIAEWVGSSIMMV